MKNDKVEVSVGIFVHNEERNIRPLLNSLWKQKFTRVRLKQVLVVSSGSFDKTNDIVRKEMGKHHSLRLITELKREGKASSINVFLRKASAPLVVSVSGDLKLHPRAIEEILLPFADESVGMVGAHPVPKHDGESNIEAEVDMLWELHHRMSLMEPKCGEMVAFRNIVHQIPKDSAVDEATLEVMLKLLGYDIGYAPRSIVYNKGPKNWKEFLIQRRRVYAGHQWIEERYNYRVSTMKGDKLFGVVADFALHNPHQIPRLMLLVLMEAIARWLGWADFHVMGKNPYMWKMISR